MIINIQINTTNKKKSFFRFIFLSELFFIVFIQGLLGFQQAYAATYYVSSSGINTNNGTSLSTPVKTITNALSKATISGDIVYVQTGTYAESINVTNNGITLSAYPGSSPVIDGASLPARDWLVLLSVDGNYNKVSGFEVKNSNLNKGRAGGYGMQVAGHHNTISKMNVHHTWQTGIIINGDYNIVEDSKIWQATRNNLDGAGAADGTGWATGLSAARNRRPEALKPDITSYTTFRRNTVFNNWGEGLSCFEADHCTMEDNIVYDNWAINLYISDTSNSLVQRNIVYVSSAPAILFVSTNIPGITLADEVSNGTTMPRSANNKIINNFIYNASLQAFSWTITPAGLNNVLIANNTIVDGYLDTGTSANGGDPITNVNSQIRNNIIIKGALGDSYVPSNAGITFSNNNWSVTPSLAKSVTDVVGDPQVTRTGTTTPGTLTSAYFKILGSSPVIDGAMVLNGVTTDFFKVVRGATPDIGGYQFTNNNNTTPPAPPVGPVGPTGYSWCANEDQTYILSSAADVAYGANGSFYYLYGVTGSISFDNTTFGGDPIPGTLKSGFCKAAAIKLNISSYRVRSITTNSAVIKWTTNAPSTSVVSYGTNAGNLSFKRSFNTLATKHSVKLTGLAPLTSYYYNISADSGSAKALSTTSSFKTTK